MTIIGDKVDVTQRTAITDDELLDVTRRMTVTGDKLDATHGRVMVNY
jgi:hypothetical protein